MFGIFWNFQKNVWNFSEFSKNVWNFSEFSKIFGIFRNFQKIVWNYLEFSKNCLDFSEFSKKKCLKMFWNFFATEQSPLPHDGAERPRRHSKKAPTSTFLGSKQRQKVARVATSGAEIDQNSEKKIFSDFQRFQDFHRARSAHPLGTPTRPCCTFHRDSPTKKS